MGNIFDQLRPFNGRSVPRSQSIFLSLPLPSSPPPSLSLSLFLGFAPSFARRDLRLRVRFSLSFFPSLFSFFPSLLSFFPFSSNHLCHISFFPFTSNPQHEVLPNSEECANFAEEVNMISQVAPFAIEGASEDTATAKDATQEVPATNHVSFYNCGAIALENIHHRAVVKYPTVRNLLAIR